MELPDGSALLYNGLSLCVDQVPAQVRNLAEPMALRPTEREHLVRRGHLTRSTPDAEREALAQVADALATREMKLDERLSHRKMVTFILTYGCNLTCAYCYQAEVRGIAGSSPMPGAFLDDFLENQVDGLLPAGPGEQTYFQLYGGEPLLPGNRGAIERILRHAREHGVSVSTVTNAVLLPAMLDLVGPEKGQINILQVTLDGEPLFHNEQRVSCLGAPTFEQTILAIRAIITANADVVIRIHVYPSRIESARLVVAYLEQEGILGHPRVKTYFWSTEDLHRQAIPACDWERFADLFLDVARKQNALPTAHFAFLQEILGMKAATGWPVRNHCSLCVSGLHCVVDPLGDLYECIDDAGRKERRVGAWSAGKISRSTPDEPHRKPYLRDQPECLECSVALFCGGGCHNRLRTTDSAFCLQIKDFIGLALRTAYLL